MVNDGVEGMFGEGSLYPRIANDELPVVRGKAQTGSSGLYGHEYIFTYLVKPLASAQLYLTLYLATSTVARSSNRP